MAKKRKETAIEVKVGALVLVAIALLALFVLVLGDFSLGKGFHLFVDFNNAAGLKPGAPVRVSGIPAGRVESISYRGGVVDEEVGRPVYVRTRLFVENRFADDIRTDAEFVITTQGVLGEPYIEISSRDRSLPEVEAGAKFRGIDPPRMDMLLASMYDGMQGLRQMIDSLNEGIQSGEIKATELINNFADLAGNINERVVANRDRIDDIVGNVDGILAENRERIPPILDNVRGATGEAEQLGASLNRAVGTGDSLRNTLSNVEETTAVARREAEPLLVSVRETADTANRILSDNEEHIGNVMANADTLTGNLTGATQDVEEMVASVRAGEGSLGRFLQDEEIFEDVREFVREIKRRPWRVLWKE